MKVVIGPYKDKGKRKIEIKIDGYDVWSMDHTLSYIILPMLKRLKKDKQGAPATMHSMKYTSEYGYGQTNHCFDFYKEGDELAQTLGFAEWDEIMDKMIWSFKQIKFGDWEEQYWNKKPKFKDMCVISNGAYYDSEGAKLHEERIQEGLDLFSKYYKNLWD